MHVLPMGVGPGTLRLLGRRPPASIACSGRSRARRSGALIVCARRSRPSKAEDDGTGAPDLPVAAPPPPPAPYADALLAREYELWQRQAAMYERLLDQADREQERFAEERAAWQATEAALRQEAAELRAQLLYVLAQLNTLQSSSSGGMAATQPGPGAAARSTYLGSSQQAAIARGQPAGELTDSSLGSRDSSSSPLSPAEQVKAVVDAMKAGSSSSSTAQPTVSPPASSPVSPSAAWPDGADPELPAYAADLAAAVDAVDTTDVLNGASAFELHERRAAVKARINARDAAEPATPAEQATNAQQAEQPAASAATTAAAASPPAAEPSAAQPAAEVARGPPPSLTLGADDIFWVNQLHTGLVDMGYFPGDEDIDDFYFGDGTQSALMTMQCCEGLPETGIADELTWAKLLGPELQPKASRDLTADMMINVPGLSSLGSASTGSKGADQPNTSSSSNGAGASQQAAATEAATKPAFAELFGSFSGATQAGEKAGAAKPAALTEWPVLHEGDGGKEVHALQVALERAGFYPSEDDMRWWSFGDGTLSALKTFQACSSYPESGVCDAATWRLLLGDNASPADLSSLFSGDSADEDLAAQDGDRVWLIGEQRWEDRSRLKRR